MTAYYASTAANGGSESNNGLSHATAKLLPQSAWNLIAASGGGHELVLHGDFTDGGGVNCAGKNGVDMTTGALTIRPYTASTYKFVGAGISTSSCSYLIVTDPQSDNRGDGKDTQNSIYLTNAHHVRVQGFNFVGGGAGNGIIVCTHSGGMFRDIEILDGVVSYANYNNYGPTSASHGVYLSGSSTSAAQAAVGVNLNVLVAGVEAHHCDDQTFAYGVQTYGGNSTNQLNGVTFSRCLLHHNSNGAVIGWAQTAGGLVFINNWVWLNTLRGLSVDVCVNPSILQNSFYGHATAIDVGASNYVNDADIRNNIWSTGTYGVYVNNTSAQTHVNARFNGSWTNTNVQDANVLTHPSTVSSNDVRDPKFVDPANGDLALRSDSLERGACLTIAAAPTDYNGVTRAVAGICDRGATEFVTTSAPIITSPATAVCPATFAFNYQIAATHSPTLYGATGLPAGLSVNTGTGLITGSPTTPGASTMIVSATNASGTATQNVAVTIEALAPVVMVLA